MPDPTILFVCTGNICRSPMAEYLFRAREEYTPRWRASSAGTNAIEGCPASAAAVQALRECRIDLTPHLSRPLSANLIDSAGMIVVMSGSHREQIRTRYPAAMDRVFKLKDFSGAERGGDVMDPIGMSVETYRHIRDEIDAALSGLMTYIRELG